MSVSLSENGWEMVPDVMDAAECAEFIHDLGPVTGAGRRGLLAEPKVHTLAHSERLLQIVRPCLPAEPRPVRVIYFDKSPGENWLVTWHQDLTIAVRERVDVPGFGPWSVKDGVPHVQPPVDLLEQMVTVRIHLDDADASNGALRVLPGSHRHGRLASGQIQHLRESGDDVLCAARAGDALLMRPLILHASGKSTSEHHRRILHIEYAGFELPSALRWAEG